MRYTNPILFGDYSDPDVIRVEDAFYMISSSFTYLPGIPVLRSQDLVHWTTIGYVARRLPFPRYDLPAHKSGTWAPSIRWHNGLFYVFVCLPDEGLLVFTAADPAGDWDCHHVKDVSGWIDPCPLFDEDGRVWLVHGFAASRCGINNILYVHEMSPDALQVLDKGRLVYSGAEHGDVTVEGPKFYRRDGYYWILCPAGGVKPGSQLALRSRSVFGPYERQVVLSQGSTGVNGPHQGGWFDDGHGRDWFIHFQDIGVYGRIPHLQPVDWSSGWPVMGCGGEPVPGGDTGLREAPGALSMSDEFAQGPGIQWQWQANPCEGWYRALRPGLRLFAAPADSLFGAGQFLSQLMQCRDFDMDVHLTLHAHPGDQAGIGMMGYAYSYAALRPGEVVLVTGRVEEGTRFTRDRVTEQVTLSIPWGGDTAVLRLSVRGGKASYGLGATRERVQPLPGIFPLTCGGWTSARPGIFCMNRLGGWGGWADAAWVRTEALG